MIKLFSTEARKDALAFLLILSFALVVKLIHLEGMAVGEPLRGDALQFAWTAINIADKGVFADDIDGDRLTVNRLPGYPLVLSPIWALTKDPTRFYHGALLLNVALGLLAIALMYKVARTLFSIGIATALSLLLVLNPHVLVMEGYVLNETLFLLEMLALIWTVSLAVRTGRATAWLAAGAIVGFALLTKPSFLLFLPFAVLFIFLTQVERRLQRSLLLKGGLGMLLVITPWLLYTQVHDVPFTGTKADSVTFAAGFYPDFVHEDPLYYGAPYHDPAAPDIHYDKFKALQQLAQWVREDPVKYLSWFLIGKPMALWQWDRVQGQGELFVYPASRSVFFQNPFFQAVSVAYKQIYPIMLVLMLVGLARVIFNRGDVVMLHVAAIVLYFLAIHIVFFSLPRYSVPLRPMMLLLDGYAIAWLLQMFETLRGKGRAATPVSQR